MMAAILSLFGAWVGLANAAEGEPWYVGTPVAQVSLEAPLGELPEEDLSLLLRAQPGAAYHPADVRADLRMLYSIGLFAAVEAQVEPAISYDDEGEPEQGAWLIYQVWAAPVVGRVRITGNTSFPTPELLREGGVRAGARFFPDADVPALEARLLAFYRAEGFPDVSVVVEAVRVAPTEIDLRVSVSEGTPRVLCGLVVDENDVYGRQLVGRTIDRLAGREVVPRWVRRLAREHGLVEGRRYKPEEVSSFRRAMETELHDRGMVQSKVILNRFSCAGDVAGDRLAAVVTQGEHVVVKRGSPRLPTDKRLADILGVAAGERLTEGWVAEAELRVERHLARAGYLDADATVTVGAEAPSLDGLWGLKKARGLRGLGKDEHDEHRYVEVTAQLGTRYRLRTRDLRFEIEPAYVGVASELDEGALRDAMWQSDPEVFGRKWVFGRVGRRRGTEDAVEAGLPALRAVYRSLGYRDAELQILHYGVHGRRIRVWVQVVEGRQTFVTRVAIAGAVTGTEAVVDAQASSLVDQPFNLSRLQGFQRAVTTAHRDLGYLEADAELTLDDGAPVACMDKLGMTTQMRRDLLKRLELDPTAEVPLCNTVEALVQVDPAERVYLRNVIVRGHRRTRRSIVAQEIAAVPLTTGQPLTDAGLAQLRSQLYELDLFDSVSTSLSGDDPRARDLVVEVTERPSVEIEVGAGGSTDEGVRSYVAATRRNLGGRGRKLSGVAEAGLGWEGEDWSIDTTAPEWSLSLRYEAPHVPVYGQRLFADLLVNEQDLEPTYRLQRSALGAGVKLDIDLDPLRRDEGSVSLDYRAEIRSLEDVDPGALVPGDPWLDEMGVLYPDTTPVSVPAGPRSGGGPGLVLVLDKRDDPFNPTRGSNLRVHSSVWSRFLGEEQHVKVYAQAGKVVPLGRPTLHLRARAGAGWSDGRTSTLPVEDRFHLGGSSSMRGYVPDSVGPKNNVADESLPWPDELEPVVDYVTRNEPDRWVATGGDAMALSVAEIWFPLADFASLVTFVDVGNVFFLKDTTYATTTNLIGGDAEPALRYGTGVGLRYATPVGPLQLDLGVNPVYYQKSWAEARGEVPVRLHLAIGSI